MRKFLLLIPIIYLFVVSGCSKESPVSSIDSNSNQLTDGPSHGYYLTFVITQHTEDGDIILVNRGFAQDYFNGTSPTYYFTTDATTPSTFTITRTVTWTNITPMYGVYALWSMSASGYLTKSILIPQTANGTITETDTGYLSPGNSYSYYMGISIITEEK